MINEVSLDELDKARSDGDPVVDVRDSEEYAEGHVPGARLIPLGVVLLRVHELPKDRPVYVICQSGGRSMQAAESLIQSGIDARSVAGGTGAWMRSGRPIETGSPRQQEDSGS